MEATLTLLGKEFKTVGFYEAAHMDLPCVYVITDGVHALFVGETDSLGMTFRKHPFLDACVDRGATHVGARIMGQSEDRLSFSVLLRDCLTPPIGNDPPPSDMDVLHAARHWGRQDMAEMVYQRMLRAKQVAGEQH